MNEKENQGSSLNSQESSVQKKTRSTLYVAASPLNGVKLELGVVLFLGFALWLAADSITASLGKQLIILITYGLIGAVWLIARTRRVMREYESNEADRHDFGELDNDL